MSPQPAHTAIIVDSACDLPEQLLQDRGIFVLPIGVQIGDKRIRDRRMPEMVSEFTRRTNTDPGTAIRTTPTSADTIRNFIITHIVDRFENLLIMCISSTRSEIYRNALEAKKMLPAALFHSRLESPPKLKNIEVVDTLSVFSGQALLAYYASIVSPTNYGLELHELADIVRSHTDSVCTYVIPDDLAYLKNRGQSRNEKSIGTIDYLIGKTFGLRPIIKWQNGRSWKIAIRRGFSNALDELGRIVRQAIDEGLNLNSIVVSYSGDLERLKYYPEYRSISEYADKHNVTLILSTMSMTASVYLGPGAISVSYC